MRLFISRYSCREAVQVECMETFMDVIYFAGENKRLMQIAYESGYLLGIRSDLRDDGFPISFVDIDYKHPDFEAHLAIVAKHQPKYATVPDLSETEVSEADVARALAQAACLSQYCEHVLIVPKLSGQLAFIPPQFAIAYSVPTSYGGAKYGVWKLAGRRVHLLGGSPHVQMKLYHYLRDAIQSVDGNLAQKLALQFAKYWQAHKWVKHPLQGQGIEDLYFDCWRKSCQNIRQQWSLIA